MEPSASTESSGEAGAPGSGDDAGGDGDGKQAGTDAGRAGTEDNDCAEADPPLSDTELVARLRDGEDVGGEAYALLYRRHAAAVRGYARTCCRDVHTAEDLTNEVFAATLQAVRRGAGPDTAVRAYLLTTVRRVAAAWARSARREQLVEDFAVFAVSAAGASVAPEDTPVDPGADVRAMRQAETSLAVQAFRSLPERWQTVLWHTTVEEETPSQVAPLLGLSPNATAVLAHRAREGLRQAYLQAHVSASLTSAGSCAQYADRLGAYARGGLRMRAERGLRKHLAECARCRTAALELADVNARLRAVLPVALIGWFTAGASVKAVAGLAAGAGTAAGAGAAAAAGSGTSGAGGTSGGAAVGEGLGAPAKVALGVGAAVLAAGAVLAYALSGDSPEPPRKPQARSSAAPVVPSREPDPTPPEHRSPAPRPVAKHAAAPAPASSPAPTPTPAASPSATPSAPPPPTRPAPPPPPARKPSPKPTPPPPEPTVYRLNDLDFDVFGDAADPQVRIDEGSLVWQREGLRVGGVTYRHGVSVGPSSSVAIDLNRSCTAFDAMAGLDDLSLGFGSVRFSVFADGERLWTSRVVHGGDPAVPVHTALTGRRTLRLEVETVAPGERTPEKWEESEERPDGGDVLAAVHRAALASVARTALAEPALADWAASRITCT
ncbi:sigma-70 family RNA polymerase sigma factor [Streptomyces sp. I05A-00742]|uniref:sigma-70 family RNA polymerase sigma factor n=1 Tax=Streptomyces sp. I05A-00742 TaxID=2732853 RepID=UPI00148800F0|nr:sigma-70 family RNA polymerase sigma factor [Streptomyces sp. I05A-00742]